MDMDTEACNVSKQGLDKRSQRNGNHILTAKRVWQQKTTFHKGDYMTSRQKLCRAQLNRPGRQSHIDIRLKEHQWRSYESVGVQCMRAKKINKKRSPLSGL